MKLNADGSCEFYTIKVKGRHKIKTSSSRYQALVLFDKDNTKQSRWNRRKDEGKTGVLRRMVPISGEASGEASMLKRDMMATVPEFQRTRNWEQFHKPKELVAAITVEASELLEIFPWKSHDEATRLLESPSRSALKMKSLMS